MKWQSMKTAPMDGTVFLLREHYKEINNYYSCWFYRDEWLWVLNDDERSVPLEGDKPEHSPENWMWMPEYD